MWYDKPGIAKAVNSYVETDMQANGLWKQCLKAIKHI